MGKALAQLFAFFTTLFGSLERTAKIIDNLATVGEEMSQLYVDQSRHDRSKQRMLLDRELSMLTDYSMERDALNHPPAP